MNDRDLDRIIDDVLDGVAQPGESAWLKERLEHDAALVIRYRKRAALFQALDAGQLVAAPDDLAPAVLNAIRGQTPNPPTHAGWLSAVREALLRRPTFGLGYAFGTGAAIGALVTVAIIERSMLTGSGPLPVNGTMAPTTAGAGWPIDDHAQLSAADLRGDVRLQSNGATLVAELETYSTHPAQWTLEFDPSLVRAVGFDRAHGNAGRFEAEAGRIQFETSGASLTRVRLDGPPNGGAALRVTLHTADAVSQGVLHSRPRARASP